MTLEEFKELLDHVREKYDSKMYLMLIVQFSMGLRASEMLAVQVCDFRDNFRYLDYRQAKTNNIIYSEPLPEPVAELIRHYVGANIHRFKDGYLFSNYTGRGKHISTECYGSFWCNWRRNIAKKNPAFKDKYYILTKTGKVQHRYRISSHSLRRLHRTVLYKAIPENLKLLKELCHYESLAKFELYINEQELVLNREKYLMPILTPIVENLALKPIARTQTRMTRWTSGNGEAQT